MNTKAKWLIVAGVMIVFLVGASIVYNAFTNNDTLRLSNTPKPTASEDKIADSKTNPETDEPQSSQNPVDEDLPADSEQPDDSDERQQAPDFTVYDIDGNAVSLSDFIGKKPVVINFWASWCPPCKAELPDFQEVFDEYSDEVEFMMVDMIDPYQETIETAKDFITENGYTFNVYFDSDGDASYTYGIASIPCTAFIDKDGYIVNGFVGMIDRATIDENIALIK